MKTKVFTLAALLCCASAMYAQESGRSEERRVGKEG